jgi:hypothetical protein
MFLQNQDYGVYGNVDSAIEWDATMDAWVAMETDLLMEDIAALGEATAANEATANAAATSSPVTSNTGTISGTVVDPPQKPLPGPKPAPPPTPTPAPPDPCRDRPWATILKDLREIGNWIGWRIRDNGEPADVKNQTFDQIETSLAKHEFESFPWYKPNLNPEHGNGFHYEGQLRPSQWYHVVIHPAQDHPLIIPGDFRSRPASNVEIHCERGFLQPSSFHHLFDFHF